MIRGMLGMAFADSRSPQSFALPYYRLKLVTEGVIEKTIDLEAFLITSVKPHHVCLLVEPPKGGSRIPPEGMPVAEPEMDPQRLLWHVASLIKELEKLVEEGSGVKDAGPSIPNLLSRLFLGGKPRKIKVPDIEYRLAYSLCLDIFGDPPLKSYKLLGASLIWRVYRIESVGDELWIVNVEKGSRDRKLIKVLNESEEAKAKLFKLVGFTS